MKYPLLIETVMRPHPKTLFLSFFTLLAPFLNALPSFSIDQVGWPKFQMRNGETHCAGKTFAVRWYKGRTLLVMPLHILSPEANFSHYVRPENVASEVDLLTVMDLQGSSPLATAGKSLLKTGATVGQRTGDISTDLMAFELPQSSRLTPFNMFYGLCPVGTRVTLLSKEGNSNSQPDLYHGTISKSSPRGLVVDMDTPVLAPSCSGAPLINAKNELVGMMVGKKDIERKVIMAIPSSSLISRLYAEIGK